RADDPRADLSALAPRVERCAAVQIGKRATQAEVRQHEGIIGPLQNGFSPAGSGSLIDADLVTVLTDRKHAHAGLVQLVDSALELELLAVASRDDLGDQIEAIGVSLVGGIVAVDDNHIRLGIIVLGYRVSARPADRRPAT